MPVDPVPLGSFAAAVIQVATAIVQPKTERMFNQRADRLDQEQDLPREIREFTRDLKILEKVLRNTNKKEVEEADGGSWLKDLKKAIYDADDLLDEHRTRAAVAETIKKDFTLGVRRGWKAKLSLLSRLISFDSENWAHYKTSLSDLAYNLYNIKKDFSSIVKTGKEFPFWKDAQGRIQKRSPGIDNNQDKEPHDHFIGRIDEIRCLKRILFSKNTTTTRETIHIILIHGPTGIGKSFLANHVYNLCDVQNHFGEKRVWVRASDDDEEKMLLIRMLEKLNKLGKGRNQDVTTRSDVDLIVLQNRMKELVEGCKFLLVLDDVWIKQIEDWVSILKALINVVAEGTSIVITTKEIGVVDAIGTFCAINNNFTKVDMDLKPLSVVDISHVLINNASVLSNQNLYNQLRLTSAVADISMKCNGWPLVANSVGRSLQGGKLEDWIEYSRHFNFMIGDDKDISRLVELSYERLTLDLKVCLPIFSLFPSNFQLREEDVVALWMAHNFIQNKIVHNILKRMEVFGQERLTRMVKSSILLLDREQNNYSMHYINYQLTLSISDDDYLHLADHNDCRVKTTEHIRHLSFSGDMASYTKQDAYLKMIKNGKLRTLMFLPDIPPIEPNFRKTLKHMLDNLKVLRVLVLKHCPIKSLPKSLGYLKHLR